MDPLEIELARLPNGAFRVVTPLEQQQRADNSAWLRAALAARDRDKDGRLSSAESEPVFNLSARASRMLDDARSGLRSINAINSVAAAPATNTIPYNPPIEVNQRLMANALVLNRAEAETQLSALYNVPLPEVQRVMREALPNGMQDVFLSDLCRDRSDLNCIPLSPRHVLVSLHPNQRL